MNQYSPIRINDTDTTYCDFPLFLLLLIIENIQAIGINGIISDIKLIHATYLILAVAVKSESRKIRPCANKKGKSRWSDSPYELWLQTYIQNGFWLNIGRITEVIGRWAFILKKWISQVFRDLKKLLYVGDIWVEVKSKILSFDSNNYMGKFASVWK